MAASSAIPIIIKRFLIGIAEEAAISEMLNIILGFHSFHLLRLRLLDIYFIIVKCRTE